MIAGVDSYSYHRLFGEVRPGEAPPALTWSDPLSDLVAEARRIDADVLSLQTCFVGMAASVDRGLLAAAASLQDIVIAWGAPEGLRYGEDRESLADLLGWIELAAGLDCGLVRIVIGGPRLRTLARFDARVDGARAALLEAASLAREHGVCLAIENHADVTTTQLLRLLESVSRPDVLRVCFDTANAMRVGEDVVAATAAVAEHVAMVHLKDVAALDPTASAIAGPCSVAYGTGVVPVDAVIDTLVARGFDGPLLVELGQLASDTDERALVAECLDWLRARI